MDEKRLSTVPFFGNSKTGILLGEASIQEYPLKCPARTRARAHSTERVKEPTGSYQI